jgi:hypothetical protein
MQKSLLIISLLLSTLLSAQEKTTHPLQANDLSYVFGLKGGLSFSNMYLESEQSQFREGNNTRTGICLGLVYHKPLSRRWALQPELVYASQGYRANWGDSIWVFSEQVRHGYFNLPLLVQYVSASGFSVYTGPQVGLLVFNAHYGFKEGDLAWVGGAAYLSKTGLGAEVRFNAGLLNTGRGIDIPQFTKARNRVVQAGVVYLFARARKRGA